MSALILDSPRKAASIGLAAVAFALALAFSMALAWHGDWPHWGGSAAQSPTRRNAPPLAQLPGRPDDIASQRLEPLAPDDARKINAKTPFADLHPLEARSFRFAGSAIDRSRAVDCLAIAAMAEAGGGDPDQRAVIQVILNRVRHPAFPKTVCGVVFQGSERHTGCQFTFSCDGALSRRYSDAAWAAARRRASEALDGKVFARVGAATHYHTDWVHPVWSGQLEKIAQISTHLFFRWPGYWGSRDAGRAAYGGGEPAIAKIAWLDAHAAAQPEAIAAAEAPSMLGGPERRSAGERVGIGEIVVAHPDGGAYLTVLSARPTPAAALSVGRRLCGGRGYCRVLGWVDRRAVPSSFPVPPAARAKLSFSYVLDATNAEYIFYNCGIFADIPRDNCMPPAAQ